MNHVLSSVEGPVERYAVENKTIKTFPNNFTLQCGVPALYLTHRDLINQRKKMVANEVADALRQQENKEEGAARNVVAQEKVILNAEREKLRMEIARRKKVWARKLLVCLKNGSWEMSNLSKALERAMKTPRKMVKYSQSCAATALLSLSQHTQ